MENIGLYGIFQLVEDGDSEASIQENKHLSR